MLLASPTMRPKHNVCWSHIAVRLMVCRFCFNLSSSLTLLFQPSNIPQLTQDVHVLPASLSLLDSQNPPRLTTNLHSVPLFSHLWNCLPDKV